MYRIFTAAVCKNKTLRSIYQERPGYGLWYKILCSHFLRKEICTCGHGIISKRQRQKKWQRQKATCCICTKRGVNMCVYMYINTFIYIYMLGRQFQFLEKYKMKYLWIAIGCLWWGELFSTYPFILIVFFFKSSICRKIF